MKKWFMLSLTAAFFLATHSLISAQEINLKEDQRPFNAVEDVIAKAIMAELPGWKLNKMFAKIVAKALKER